MKYSPFFLFLDKRLPTSTDVRHDEMSVSYTQNVEFLLRVRHGDTHWRKKTSKTCNGRQIHGMVTAGDGFDEGQSAPDGCPGLNAQPTKAQETTTDDREH